MIDSAHIAQWQGIFLIKIFIKEVLLYYMSVCSRVMLANISENYYKKTKKNYQNRRQKTELLLSEIYIIGNYKYSVAKTRFVCSNYQV